MRTTMVAVTFSLALILVGCSAGGGTPAPGSAGGSLPPSTQGAASASTDAASASTDAPSASTDAPSALASGPGSSIALPSLPSFNSDANLAARFPSTIGGEAVEVTTVLASDFLEFFEPGSEELADFQAFLTDVGVGIEAVSIGIGSFTADDSSQQLSAIRAAGADGTRLLASIVKFTQESADDPASVQISQNTVGGKPVTIVTKPDEDTTYLYGAGDVVFSFETDDAALADQVMGAIP